MSEKIKKAMEILKSSGAKGKFKAYIADINKNNVEIFTESGLYCIINIKSGKIIDC